MDKKLSKKISFINFVLSVSIVVLHSTYNFIESNISGLITFQYEIMRVYTIMSAVSVPLFFSMSAYLFFISYKEIGDYFLKIKKRFISIVIPFLFWNVLTYIYYFILVRYTNVFDEKTIPNDLKAVLIYIFNSIGDPPLWYLKTLFLFFLVSPMIYFVIKLLKRWSWVLVCAVMVANMVYLPDYESLLYWLPQILMGTWFALYGQDYLLKRATYSNKTIVICACLVLAFLVSLFFINNEKHPVFYMWRVVSVVLIWVLMSVVKLEKIKTIPNCSFFMYCSHFMIIEAIRGVLIKVLGINEWSVLLIWVLTFSSTIFVILAFSKIIKRRLPRLWCFLNGNRV